MTSEQMNVVCATRGGEGSRIVQRVATAYAKEHDAKLYFVFVVDESGYPEVVEPLREALGQELVWLGQTLLKLAQMRSQELGISAEFAILKGDIRDQIAGFLREKEAVRLFVGAPRGTNTNIFGDDEIERFATEVETASSVPVQIVRPEEA